MLEATAAARNAIDRVRGNLRNVDEHLQRWSDVSESGKSTDPSALANRILKMLDGPDFQAFVDLAKALERGRTPSQRGWRESLPDLGYRLVGIRRRLAELARTVSAEEQQFLAKENRSPPSVAQSSRLSRVGAFVKTLEDAVLGPLRNTVDIR